MPRARKTTITTDSKRIRRSTTPIAPTSAVLPTDEIAAEAYAQYLARNGQQGDALNDWLIAERIVKQRYVTTEA